MPQFSYKAQNEKGKAVRGSMAAADEAELQRSLKEQNLLLLSAEEENTGSHTVKRIRDDQLSEFSRQIGTLIGSGVSLVRALSIIAQQETLRPYERETYQQVLRHVRQGTPLSDAMDAMGGAFPDLLINMYRSAEAAGNLDKVSLRMAVHYDKQWRLGKKVKSAMTYPKILSFLIVVVVAIIMGFVLPRFQDLFSQMEKLPLATRILIGTSNFFVHDWIWLILIAALCISAWMILKRIRAIAVWLDKCKLYVPIFGKMNRVVVTARFARSLASLYSSGIPILTCLTIARRTIGNQYVESQFDDVLARVKNGESLSEALSHLDGFLKKLEFSIRVGEETGALDSMLDSIADSLEFESEMAIGQMVSYLEPAMIVIMAVIVGFVMIAVLIPIYNSYQVIGAGY
jgi:type IV pilus assembly protein PilC